MTSFTVQAGLTEDRPLMMRIAACVAGEGISGPDDPLGWAYERRWQFAVQPGWSEAAAETSDSISDQMIRDGVAAVVAASPPDEPDSSE